MKSIVKKVLGAVVLLPVVATKPLLHWLGLGTSKQATAERFRDATPLSVSFEVREPIRPKIAANLSCEEATDAKNAFAAYEAVREELVRGADPETIEYLACFLPGDARVGSAKDVLERFMGNVFEANVLYGLLQWSFESVLYRSVQEGKLRHNHLAWRSRGLGQSALLAYANTRRIEFVDLYVEFFRRVMLMRDSVLGIHDDYHARVMDAWGSANLGRNSGDEKLWVAHVTHFSLIMYPATGFARHIRNEPRLAAYRSFADEVVAFFDSAYRQFDDDLRPAPGTDEVWYWRPWVDKFEATNHLHLQGQALLNMYALTGDEFYAERIRWIIRVFEEGVEIDDDGLVAWNYHPYLQVPEAMRNPNAREHSEFVWKAAVTVPFIYQAHQDGFAIAPKILAAMTKTIRDHVVANNDYALNVHPKGSRPISARETRLKTHAAAASITGFLCAAMEDPSIKEKIRTIVATRPDLYPSGWSEWVNMTPGYAFMLRRE